MARRSSNTLAELVGVLCLFLAYVLEVKGQDEIYTTCEMQAGSGVAAIHGTVYIHQKQGSDIEFEVVLMGFEHHANATQHGFHIHQEGNLGHKCNDSLGHYNPDNVNHGGPEDAVRHVGDLGNVVADGNGEVRVKFTDRIISLFGDRSIINRAFVVHEHLDDLGRGNFSDSKTTGHAGARYGCCIIRQPNSGAGKRWSDVQPSVVAILFLAWLTSSIY